MAAAFAGALATFLVARALGVTANDGKTYAKVRIFVDDGCTKLASTEYHATGACTITDRGAIRWTASPPSFQVWCGEVDAQGHCESGGLECSGPATHFNSTATGSLELGVCMPAQRLIVDSFDVPEGSVILRPEDVVTANFHKPEGFTCEGNAGMFRVQSSDTCGYAQSDDGVRAMKYKCAEHASIFLYNDMAACENNSSNFGQFTSGLPGYCAAFRTVVHGVTLVKPGDLRSLCGDKAFDTMTFAESSSPFRRRDVNGPEGAEERPGHDTLTPSESLLYTLAAIFSAVGLGVFSVRLGFVSPDAGDMKALRFYVGRVAFPLLIFKTVATADLGTVDLRVVLSCAASKSVIFLWMFFFTFFFFRSRRAKAQRLLTATCFALYTVASDDFAVGFPVVQALYPADLHMDVYIAANALVGATVFVPATMVLFEVGSSMMKALSSEAADENGGEAATGGCRSIAASVFLNPVITCTILGLLYKLLFPWTPSDASGGARLPYPLYQIVNLVTSAFGMLALFSTGTVLRNPEVHSWPMLLCAMKVFVCAYLGYGFGTLFIPGGPKVLIDFAFFYGSFPTSSAPLLFTVQFDPSSADIVASATFFGLLLAAPVMLATALYLEKATVNMARFISGYEVVVAGMSVIASILWLCIMAFMGRSWGYHCKGKLTIAVYGVVAFIYSLLVFRLRYRMQSCQLYSNGELSASMLLVGWSQIACRILLIFLQLMLALNWTWPASVLSASMCIAALLALGAIPAFFVIPNCITELCSYVGGFEPSKAALILNCVWNASILVIVLILLFCTVIRHRSNRKDSDGGIDEGHLALTGGKLDAASLWMAAPPTHIARALIMPLAVRLLMQVINVIGTLNRTSDGVNGSLAAMITIEDFLELGQPMILLAALLFSGPFTDALSNRAEQVQDMLPIFDWSPLSDYFGYSHGSSSSSSDSGSDDSASFE